MKQCVHIDDYLDGALAKELRPEFEKHLCNCPHCQVQANEWRYIKASLLDWGKSRELPAPGPAKTSELLLALRPPTRRNQWTRYAAYGALPIAAAIGLVLVILFQYNSGNQIAPTPDVEQFTMRVLHSDQSEVQLAHEQTSKQLSVPKEGSLLVGVGPDRLGVGSRSQVEVMEANSRQTRIKLHRGKVAVEVDPHRKNRHFTVLAGDIAVKVVGTRFSVSMNQTDAPGAIEVSVQRGKVQVEDPRQTSHLVHKGQTLRIGPDKTSTITSLDEETELLIGSLLTVPSGDIMEFSEEEVAERDSASSIERKHHNRGTTTDPDKWRSWILEGKYSLAESAITDHLRLFPTDTESWSLLATCRRKSKQWRAALNAYQKIVELGNSKAANTARFEMARILQDRLGNHAAAAEILSEYLTTPRLLEAEAMVRLGKARFSQGRKREAREIWSQVVTRFRGTSAAIHAKNLLESAQPTRDDETTY